MFFYCIHLLDKVYNYQFLLQQLNFAFIQKLTHYKLIQDYTLDMLNCSPVVFCRRRELPSGDFAMLICMMLHSTCSSTVLYNFLSKRFLLLFVDWHVCAQGKERALAGQRSCTNEDYRGNCASMHQCVHTQHTHITLQLSLCCVSVC